MKFKNISLAVLLAAGCAMSVANAAETGTLNFTGNVITGTCGIDAASLNIPVDFGVVAASTVNANPAGKSTPAVEKDFTIKLNSCPEDLSAQVQFNGQTSSYQGLVFVSSNMTSNSGMIIKDQAGVVLTPNAMDTSESQALISGTNELKYTVGLTKTKNNVNPGPFNNAITYVISYQ